MTYINSKHILALVFLVLNLMVSICQVETFYIKPNDIDPNYSVDEDSIAISINTDNQEDRIFLFIGGTKSSSSTAYNALRLHSADLGINFINLSYPNSVAAASLSNESDVFAFDKFRQEICFGTPLSSAVEVDSLNSIHTRTLNLIKYLAENNPTGNWDKYLVQGSHVDWTKIIVGGHSQGAGHAAYIAKQFLVDRVLMFSGPNDYNDYYGAAGIWLSTDGITPVYKHFAYLSLNDEVVDFSKQYINLSALGLAVKDDTTYVDNTSPPFNNSHLLYTTQSPGLVILNHSVPVKLSSKNKDVWTYMLTSDIVSNTQAYEEEIKISVFPNPTMNSVYIQSSSKLTGEKYVVYNAVGQCELAGVFRSNGDYIDLVGLKNGIYLIAVKGQYLQILKQ